MEYIAILDYDHLDNGLFLTKFAHALAKHHKPGIILHGDSAYTERLMQTGMFREEAAIRATKDLNHRLIALLADNGVSAIGLNAYQRSLVSLKNKTLIVNEKRFSELHSSPLLIMSNLVQNTDIKEDKGNITMISLPRMADALQNQLEIESIFVFSADEDEKTMQSVLSDKLEWKNFNSGLRKQFLPGIFQEENDLKITLTTASNFGNYPEKTGGVTIS